MPDNTLEKKCFLTPNLNLPWHNVKPFPLVLLLLPGSRCQPPPHHSFEELQGAMRSPPCLLFSISSGTGVAVAGSLGQDRPPPGRFFSLQNNEKHAWGNAFLIRFEIKSKKVGGKKNTVGKLLSIADQSHQSNANQTNKKREIISLDAKAVPGHRDVHPVIKRPHHSWQSKKIKKRKKEILWKACFETARKTVQEKSSFGFLNIFPNFTFIFLLSRWHDVLALI